MPKLKIGEKVLAGSSNNERREFTDGHKSFDSFAARVLVETQTRERKAADTFERNRSKFIRSRNPITGEPTPRDIVDKTGVVLQNTGVPLFPAKPLQPVEEERPMSSRSNYSARPSSRATYRMEEVPEEPPNPLKRPDEKAQRIASLQNMQDNISGELEFLHMKLQQQRQRMEQMNKGKRYVAI